MQLSKITKVSEFMELIDWTLDGNGLVITDADLLRETIVANFDLEDDEEEIN